MIKKNFLNLGVDEPEDYMVALGQGASIPIEKDCFHMMM